METISHVGGRESSTETLSDVSGPGSKQTKSNTDWSSCPHFLHPLPDDGGEWSSSALIWRASEEKCYTQHFGACWNYRVGLLLCIKHPLGGTPSSLWVNPKFKVCNFSRLVDEGEMKVWEHINPPKTFTLSPIFKQFHYIEEQLKLLIFIDSQ